MSKWLLWLLLIGLSLPAQERLALLIGNDADQNPSLSHYL